MPKPLLLVLVFVAACDPASDTDAGAVDGDAGVVADADTTDDAGPPACEGHAGFAAESTRWAVPDSLPTRTLIDFADPGRWTTPDADGDGWVDLLIADPGQLGWRLHRGGANGFDPVGTPWTVPDMLPVREVVDLSSSGEWVTAQVDDDGVLDVLIADPGQLAWRLHRGSLVGFEPMGAAFQVPDFVSVNQVLPRPDEPWATRDVDGDGFLDLLVADRGALAWRLHRGSAQGFALEGTGWAVPDDFPVDSLVDRADPGHFLTLDVDGDGWMDALTHDRGQLAWRLHRGGEGGFDREGTTWRVPDSFPVDSVIDRTGAGEWMVLDVDGDGVLDALVADRGQLAWRLHRGGVDGFDAEGTTFSVPEPLPVDAVIDRRGEGTWLVRDVDGDGRIDLLLADPDAGAWRLHRATCG